MLDGLPPEHPAMIGKRTLFPSTVVPAEDSPRLLVSGQNNRKIGAKVLVGKWKGAPIFNLTLEERKTCPRYCYHWATCYGNGMPFARRHEHGAAFEIRLDKELAAMNAKYPIFVVRTHILGDFYNLAYVTLWKEWLGKFQGLRVFGYTAWKPGAGIGKALFDLREERWDRFAIRFSVRNPEKLQREAVSGDGDFTGMVFVSCPAQKYDRYFCGACGICWGSDKNIVFETHGRVGAQKELPLLGYEGLLTDTARKREVTGG